MTAIKVSMGIILDSEGKILIAQRNLQKNFGGMWEFPGGKQEVDESPEDALIRELKKKHPKLNKPQLEIVIDTFFQSIQEALMKKKSIELRGFGTFFIKEIKEKYSARNPKTGELIYVPKKNKVRFRASKKFKEFLNQ